MYIAIFTAGNQQNKKQAHKNSLNQNLKKLHLNPKVRIYIAFIALTHKKQQKHQIRNS